MDYNKAKIRKTWGVWAQSWLIAHGCLLELISQKKRWSDDRLWLKEQNQSSLPHWGEAARLPQPSLPTALSPMTSRQAAQNSIPPCSVNHDSSSARQDWNLKCILSGSQHTAHSSELTCSLSLPAQPGWPAAVQGQLRVSGNWEGGAGPGLGSHEEKISTPQCPAAAGSSRLSARMRDLMGVVVGWVRGAWCTDDVKSSAFRNGWLVL